MKRNIEEVPVVFVHCGNQKYLKYSIMQASKYNRTVILLGDTSNKGYAEHWYNQDSFMSEEYNQFIPIYNHMSSNSYEFELGCFRRFFIVYEYAKRNNIPYLVMMDSDCMAYQDFSTLDLVNYDVALSIPHDQTDYNWTASPHASFWKTDKLKLFIDFVVDTYSKHQKLILEKWNYHVEHKIVGGICDMTLLYLWTSSSNPRIKCFNTSKISNGTVFDHFLSVSEGHKNGDFKINKLLTTKKVKFKKEQPYFLYHDGQIIRALTIHAQGASKKYIVALYKADNKYLYLSLLLDYIKRLAIKIYLFNKGSNKKSESNSNRGVLLRDKI